MVFLRSGMMMKNLDLFKSNENSDQWKSYITYLESIIEDGLKNVIKCSLEYLIENTNKRNKKLAPFYKISMNLTDDITFAPPLSREKPHSFQQLFDTVIQRIYSPASEIRKMSDPNADYLESMEECQLLSNLKQTLTSNVSSAVAQIFSVSATFKTYSDLWMKTIEESLEDFVLYGPIIETAEAMEEDELKEIEPTPLEEKPPTEEEFKHQISQFDLLLRKVEDIPFEMEIEVWLILNVATFKERLLIMIRNWSSAYKKKLNELKAQGKLRKLEDDG
ncbi:dynein beta chain, ciliary-like [Uloborus diversus]|uniref:dynein beta chain, ciliary-like n=1 Tax=Uloborus diversus TaxID=327109 RepID=UPI00240A6722|nr:dynein beta chain, ciliary-like [Uloborus diversus]